VIFTREPIIETILSPRDGYKLCIRNSKVSGAEELFVDAIEVVSFGQAFFFRGQERPRPFLVPVSDYEIFEVKETRVVLKNVSYEKSIKINGGRDGGNKPSKEPVTEDVGDVVENSTDVTQKIDKKRDRRRSRRKRTFDAKQEGICTEEGDIESVGEVTPPVVRATSSLFTHLLPPPADLISEKLSRLREKEGMISMQESEEVASIVSFAEEEPPTAEE